MIQKQETPHNCRFAQNITLKKHPQWQASNLRGKLTKWLLWFCQNYLLAAGNVSLYVYT